jgi:hypothetical protein
VADLQISYNSTSFGIHIPNELLIEATAQQAIDLTGIGVTVSIEVNANWIVLDQGVLVGGIFTPNFILDYPIGSYNFKIETEATESVSSTTYVFAGKIRRDVILSIEQIIPASYQEAGTIEVMVEDTYDHSYLENVLIKVFYLDADLQQVYLADGYTNTGGNIQFIIPTLFNPGELTLVIETLDDGYFASCFTEFVYTIDPQEVVIEFSTQDYGITHNKSISIQVNVDGLSVQSGTIEWTILTDKSTVFAQDQLQLVDGSTFLVINGDLIGEYSLILRYQDAQGLYKTTSLVLDDIGYHAVSTPTMLIDRVEIQYLDLIPLTIYFMDTHPLQGLSIDVSVNSEYLGSYITDIHGNIYLDLSTTIPGDYMMEFSISSSKYLTEDFHKTHQLVITKGYISFDILVEKQQHPNDSLELVIIDSFYGGSQYRIQIGGQTFLLAIQSSNEKVSIFLDQPLYPGNYSLRVNRSHDHLIDLTMEEEMAIIPIEVMVEKFSNVKNSQLVLNITVATMDKEVTKYTYNLFVSLEIGSTTYSFNTSNIVLDLSGSGNIHLHVTVNGYYQGVLDEIIQFDVDKTASIETPSKNTSTTNGPTNRPNKFPPISQIGLIALCCLPLSWAGYAKLKQMKLNKEAEFSS